MKRYLISILCVVLCVSISIAQSNQKKEVKSNLELDQLHLMQHAKMAMTPTAAQLAEMEAKASKQVLTKDEILAQKASQMGSIAANKPSNSISPIANDRLQSVFGTDLNPSSVSMRSNLNSNTSLLQSKASQLNDEFRGNSQTTRAQVVKVGGKEYVQLNNTGDKIHHISTQNNK